MSKTYYGTKVTTIHKTQSDDEWLFVELADGKVARMRLWYLRKIMEADKHVSKG